MLSGMLSLFMVWTAPRLRDVGFNWSGFMGGMVAFYGFCDRSLVTLFSFIFLPCYNFFGGLIVFNFFIFCCGFWGWCRSWCNFRWRRATSSFGCSCRISKFMMLSLFFSVVDDVVGMIDGFGLDVTWAVSSEFFSSSLPSFFSLSVQVIVAIFCDILSVALSMSLL